MHLMLRSFLRGGVLPAFPQCPPQAARSLSPMTGTLPPGLSSPRAGEGAEEGRLSSGEGEESRGA